MTTPAEPKYSDAEIRAIANEACRYDNSRYQPWSDSRSPHYGDAEHFVRRVLAALASRPSTPDKAGVSDADVSEACDVFLNNVADHQKGIEVDMAAMRAALEHFATQSAEAVRDGERYRWLRNDPPTWLSVRKKENRDMKSDGNMVYLDADALDQAIDAAMQEQSHD